jgi:pimeloyl-ACP methyl ester carboxylesterase
VPITRSHGIDIHYAVRGSGTPIVLLHSFLCSGEMWEHQHGALAANHRVLTVDARGHGCSGRIDRPFAWSEVTDDVVAVLDDDGVDRAVWIGLSMGGMTALHAAIYRPARVRGLALLDTNGGVEPTWQRFKLTMLGRISRIVGLRPLMPAIEREMFGSTTRRTQPALVRQWSRRFTEIDLPSAFHVLHAFLRREDLSSRLAEIHIPSLVLVGAEDRAQPPERARRIAELVPGARYVEVPKAGHLSSVEQPDSVTQALLEFLETIPSAT